MKELITDKDLRVDGEDPEYFSFLSSPSPLFSSLLSPLLLLSYPIFPSLPFSSLPFTSLHFSSLLFTSVLFTSLLFSPLLFSPLLLLSLSHIYCRDGTPLCLAIKGGHIEIVKFLVEEGADIYSVNGDNEYASHIAAKNGVCSHFSSS